MNKRMSPCMTIPRGHHFFPTFQSGQVNTEQGRVPVLHDNGVLQTMSEELEKQSQIDYKNKIKAGMPQNIKGFVKPFCWGWGGGGGGSSIHLLVFHTAVCTVSSWLHLRLALYLTSSCLAAQRCTFSFLTVKRD